MVPERELVSSLLIPNTYPFHRTHYYYVLLLLLLTSKLIQKWMDMEGRGPWYNNNNNNKVCT
jgi:hypothetical protein